MRYAAMMLFADTSPDVATPDYARFDAAIICCYAAAAITLRLARAPAPCYADADSHA